VPILQGEVRTSWRFAVAGSRCIRVDALLSFEEEWTWAAMHWLYAAVETVVVRDRRTLLSQHG